MNPLPVWRQIATFAARCPALFLLASLALAATDLLLWRLGLYDGERPPGGPAAAVLLAKVAILPLWALLALRLLDDPGKRPGEALRLDGRQFKWLAGTLLLLPLLFGLRLALTRLAGLVAAPPAALIAGMVLYLILSLILLVRLLPALIGVLIGDQVASLAWSWRATSGRALASVVFILAVLAPLVALHVGFNLGALRQAATARAVLLILDGAAMALLMASAMAGYRALYLKAKAAP